MTSALLVAGASARTLRRHVARSLGGSRPAFIVALAIAGLVVVMNVMLYRFSDDSLAVAFDPARAEDPLLHSARTALVVAQMTIPPVVALGLLILTPTISRIGPAARIAGATRQAIAIGELLPFVLAVALVVALGGIGPAWFIAVHQPTPVRAMCTLTVTSVGSAIFAVGVHGTVVTVARAAGVAPVVARLIALVGSFAGLGAVLADLLSATAHSAPSLAGRALDAVWGSDPDRLGGRALLGGALLLLCAAALTWVARLAERDDGAFPRMTKVVGIRPGANPGSVVSAVRREFVLLLRHPVGQTTTATSLVLGVLLVLGCRGGVVPMAVAIPAFAMLFSANCETAYGRSASWRWVRRLAGQRSARLVVEQYLGGLPVAVVGTLVATAVVLLIEQVALAGVAATIGSTAVLVAALSAVAYLAGVLLPFDDGAPTAVVGTSVLTMSIEGLVLWVGSLIAAPGTLATAAFDVFVGGCALAVAAHVVHRRA